MLPSLLLVAAVAAPGAPVPLDTVPNTTGPAPRVAAVKADGTGAVWVTAQVYEKRKVMQSFVANENGKNVVRQREVEQMMSNYIRKTIGDFGGKFTTADGSTLTTEDATRRVKDGATLLITADGKPVDQGWLKAVRGDAVIMTAEGLAEAHFVFGNAPYPLTPAPRLTMLGTNEKGEVRLPVNPNPVNGNGQVYYNDFNGGFNGRVINRRVIINNGIGMVDESVDVSAAPATTPPGADGKKALPDVKFEAYDATGKLVSRSEALTRLKAGGLVVLAGDNRFPDADYLKAFRDDLLVLVSSELSFPAGTPNPYDFRTNKPAATAPGKPGAVQQLLPVQQALPPQRIPAVQIAPAVIKRVQVQVEK